MISDGVVTLVVMGASIAVFIWNRLPVGVVALATTLALLALGIVDTSTAFSGFGDPVVIFLASLFVVAEGLDASGVTAWIARAIAGRVRRQALLVATLMVVTALLSALITPNGAVAAMIPVVLTSARSLGFSPSRILMPVAFAASAGALLMMSGSVVNVLVSQTAEDNGVPGFGFFEFGVAGVALVVGTVIAALAGGRLIPADRQGALAKDLSGHVTSLVDHYQLERGFYRLRVDAPPESRVTARDLEEGLAHHADVYAVQTQGGGIRGLDETLHQGDDLLVTGSDDEVDDLVRDAQLRVVDTPVRRSTRSRLVRPDAGPAEVLVAPRSILAGKTVFTGMRRGVVTILGVRHSGRDVGTEHVALVEGDALLLHGPWDAIQQLVDDHDVLVVDCPELMRRQLQPLGWRARVAMGITAAMVVAIAAGLLEPAVAALVAACAMVVSTVVAPSQAYRAISWQTIVLIGGLIPLSTAIRTSGAADLVADGVLAVAADGGTLVVLSIVFVVTAVLGQFISNTATALVMVPIVVAIAQTSGTDLRVMLMSLAVASGASLLTPIATPANMLVGAAAGYRFGDYRRFGSLVMVVWFAVAVFLVPAVWSP